MVLRCSVSRLMIVSAESFIYVMFCTYRNSYFYIFEMDPDVWKLLDKSVKKLRNVHSSYKQYFIINDTIFREDLNE